MLGESGYERLWAGLDRLLLIAVFILLGLVWYSDSREAAGSAKEGCKKRDAASQLLKRANAEQRVDGLRVALDRQRMNTIARSMVDTGWDESPPSPAVDMRGDGSNCDVFFTLPEGIEEDNVRVTLAGHVLTLMMKDEESGRLFLQRIRIPYGIEGSDHVQTTISNDVLRVRLCPCPTGK